MQSPRCRESFFVLHYYILGKTNVSMAVEILKLKTGTVVKLSQCAVEEFKDLNKPLNGHFHFAGYSNGICKLHNPEFDFYLHIMIHFHRSDKLILIEPEDHFTVHTE